jgi:hypothetical protein
LLSHVHRIATTGRHFRTFRWPDSHDTESLSENQQEGIEMATADLAALRIDDFTPHLEAVFDMQTAGGVVPLKLVKADLVGDSGRAGGAFSLIFVAPQGARHPQAIYPVTHPALGIMEIFLVPVGSAQGGNGYQAIFT